MNREKVLEFKTINDVIEENAALKREKRELNNVIENEIAELKSVAVKDKSELKLLIENNSQSLKTVAEKDEKDKSELKLLIEKNRQALKTKPNKNEVIGLLNFIFREVMSGKCHGLLKNTVFCYRKS